jgi:DNA repair protein RadC
MYHADIYKCTLFKERTIEYGHTDTPEKVFEIMCKLGAQSWPEEHLYLFCLASSKRVVGVHELSHGSIRASITSLADIFKRALLNNATEIILAHNHPSGRVVPSAEDISTTRKVIEAGKLLEITLVDHVIIGDDQYCSLQEANLI